MRSILLSGMLLSCIVASAQWSTNFEEALSKASQEKKLVLLNFSGSDWCGPCIKMKKEIFDSEQFQKLADSSLVLVNADFPRSRKNQLPKALQQQNDDLAGRYNSMGKFPLTLLIDAKGKIMKSWEGYGGGEGAQAFMNELRNLADARRIE